MKKIIILFGILLFSSTFVFSQNASLSIGTVGTKVGESVSVPINALNLSDVGAISLKINYDPTKLSFQGVANAPTNVQFIANATGGVIALGWFDATASNPLALSSGKLVDLKFNVIGGDGSVASLSFLQEQCEIANSQATTIPVSYNDGGAEINVASFTKLAISSAVAAVGSEVVLPIKVMQFNGIAAISLKINYNPTELVFGGLVNAPSGVNFTSNAANGVITIGWFDATGGSAALTLADSSSLVGLKFTYNGSNGESVVSFNSQNCELADANGSVVANVIFANGGISPLAGTMPSLKIGDVQAAASTNFSVPITAKNLVNVGAISLKVKYNAALLNFTGISNAPANISFTSNASTGVISLGWFDATGNTPVSIDSAKLVDLNFSSTSTGSSNIEFLGGESEISNSLGQIIVVEYINGSVQLVTDVAEQGNQLPTEYQLSQNFPNPFNPSTMIKYSIPKEGMVTLKVFDMLGKEVATLVNKYQTPGNYSVNFNASNLPSGVYIYKIESNNFSAVKKLMLLK